MKKYIVFFIILFICITVRGQNEIYFQTDFSKGIPTGVSVIDRDENPVISSDFNHITPTGSWFNATVDTPSNDAALSTSHCQYDFPAENWLITPAIHISSADAWLTWEAKSIHYDFRENYKVMISTSNKNFDSFAEIYSVTEENYNWNTHHISLSPYTGKDIYVAFVHTSTNKFILALDNLFIGIPSSLSISAIDSTQRFVGDIGSTSVKGKLINNGKTIRLDKIICKDKEQEYGTQGFGGKILLPGEEQEYSFTVPVEVGKVANYTLEAVADGTNTVFLQDSIICSYFPRTLVAEESTGTWCDNCPAGILQMNKLKDRYQDQIITITAHYNDELTYNVFSIGIGKWLHALPAFIYNRDEDEIQGIMNDLSHLRRTILKPTVAKVDFTCAYTDENQTTVKTQAKTVFAKDYDNSNGKYKLGYAIIEKEVLCPDMIRQKNNASLPQNNEFYYLPYLIPNDLMIFHDLPRGTESAFDGIESSLPDQIKAYEEYTYDYDIELPKTIIDKTQVRVICFIINSVSRELLNACEVNPNPVIPSSLNKQVYEKDIKIYFDQGNSSYIIESDNLKTPYTLQLIGLDGKIFHTETIEENIFRIPKECFPQSRGCYLIRIKQDSLLTTKKIILY